MSVLCLTSLIKLLTAQFLGKIPQKLLQSQKYDFNHTFLMSLREIEKLLNDYTTAGYQFLDSQSENRIYLKIRRSQST